MDIDLLFTAEGEAGVICNENPVQKAIGLVFDTKTGILTLEFADMDYLEMNIPVEQDFFAPLDHTAQIHMGAIKNGHIAQAYQIPFMFLDDPYRGDAFKNVRQLKNPLVAFERFVKRCSIGQPIHRDDLGNEESMGCVLGDSSPSSLQFAPHLARRHALEAAPKVAPRGPGPSTPGLGGGGGGGGGGSVSRNTTPPRRTTDDDE
jgi:hypothetical protein